MAYFRGHFVPEDDKEEKRMALCARNYRIVNGDLYRGGLRAPPKVHLSRRRQTVARRDSCRHVLFAYCDEGIGRQSFSRRFLLAFGGGRRARGGRQMPKLPKTSTIQQVSTRRSTIIASGVAPRTLGHRHRRAPAHGARKLQVCYSCSGIFLEVGSKLRHSEISQPEPCRSFSGKILYAASAYRRRSP